MTTQLYIFEGPDGAGKTTTIEHLKQTYLRHGFNVSVFHQTYNESLTEQWAQAKRVFESGVLDVLIMDRSPESELCYGPVLRGTVRGSDEEWRDWRHWSRRANAQKILLMDDPTKLIERAFSRGETYLSRHQLHQVIDLYESRLGNDSSWYELYGLAAQNAWLINLQRNLWK
jgi:thymidylate kinase